MLTNYLQGLCCLVVFVAIADSCSIQSTKKYVSRGSSVDMPVNVKLPVSGQVVSYSVKLASESGNIISVSYYGSAVIGSSFAKITFTRDFSTGNLSYTIKSMNDSFIGDHEVRRSDPAALLNCTTLYILGKPILAFNTDNPVLEGTVTLTYTCVSAVVPSGKPTAPTLVANTDRHLIGDTITFLCTSVSTTAPSDHNLSMSYSWTVDDVTNPTDSRYTYSTSRHTLTLSDVTKGDSSKILRCTATEVVTGGLTSDTSNTYSINVLYGPDSVNLNPSSVSYTKNEGTLLSNIQCSADCNPACTYRWRKQGQTTIVSTNGALILGLLQRSETGTYICTATNPNMINEAQILVNVRYAPDITTSLSSNNLVEHSSVQLKCNAAGVPDIYNYTAITQTWRGTTIPNTRPPVSNTPVHSSLQFTDLQLQDTGIYTCHVNNGVTDLYGILDQTATVFLQVKVSPHLLVKNTLRFAGLLHSPINITIPFYSYPEISSVSLHRADGTKVTSDAAHSVSYTSAEVTTQFYGTDVILNGSIFEFYVNYLSEEDFATYKLRLQNDIGLSEVTVSIKHENIPESPRLFRFMGVIGSVPQLFWVKGFNGGYKQYFAIETTLTDTDDWVEQVRIDEGDQRYYLQPMQSYIANITGLSPGHHRARLLAGNKIGKRTTSEELTIFFNIPKGDYECPNHCVQEDDSLKAIVGGVGTAVIAVIIIAVVVLVLQRRRCNSEMANSSEIGSNICNPRGRKNPVETRQSDGTFKNEVFEDDEPVHIGVEDTSYVNENRPTYESLLEQIPNPATYETIATNSNIQTGEMYESLDDSREQSRNYDSLTASVENATHGLMPGQYENL